MGCIVAAWICIFLTSQILPNLCKTCSFVCSFWQPYMHNMEYNIVSYFCNFFKWGGELVRRAQIFIVEVAMKFGVLLAILRHEAKKIPRNLASCLVLTCVFDTKKVYLKKRMDGSNFWGDMYPTKPSHYTTRFTSIAIDLPEEIKKNEYML